MNKIFTTTIFTLLILSLLGYFVFQRFGASDNSLDLRPDLKSEERSGLAENYIGLRVQPLILNDQTIEFPHTDNNDNESIIIKSDKDRYTSFAGSDVYFSVTNTSDLEEDGILLFHFDQSFKRSNDDPSGITKPRVHSLEQRADNNWSKHNLIYNNISINATKLAQALDKKKDIPETFDVSAGTQFKLAANQTAYFKAKISYPPGSEGEFWIETLGENGGYGLLDPWYASTYTHRKKITIDNAMVSGGADLSNFPVLISFNNDLSLKGTAFGGKVASGSGEFVFTSSDGTTKLDHEVEYYSALNGQIVAWVEVPTLDADADTVLYLYFGGPTTGATNQNVTGVWDDDYLGVWHLGESVTDESSATDVHKDSNNTNHANQSGNTNATGKIGIGQRFSGTDDEITSDDIGAIDTATELTACSWVMTNNDSADHAISEKADSSSVQGYLLFRDDSAASGRTDTFVAVVFDSADTDSVRVDSATNAALANRWYHVCMTYVASSATGLRLYINGAEDANSPISTSSIAAIDGGVNLVRFGARTSDAQFLDGYLDEERISDIARSAAWIATEYNNQNVSSTYVTAEGAEKEIRTAPNVLFKGGGGGLPWYSDSFSYRKPIVIDKNRVFGSSDLTNFPVLISKTDLDLRTVANGGHVASGSGEFVFTSDNGTTTLDYEIESYSATTGEIIAWVEVPTLKVASDTTLFMYYGGPTSGATNQNPTGTFATANGYQGVWHLPNGTTLTALDSTSNGNNGTITAAVATSGKADGAGSFNGTSAYVDLTGPNSLTTGTLSFWMKDNANASGVGIIDATTFVIQYDDSNSGKLNFALPGVSNDQSVLTITNQDWHYVAVLFVSGDVDFYIDGVADSANLTPSFSAGSTIAIGRRETGSSLYFKGSLDDIRISSTVRTAAWIKTEYNNQSAPSNFATFGNEKAKSSGSAGIKIKG